MPFLKGAKTGAPHDALYWRFGQQMAIRMGDWKIIRAAGAGTEQERAQLRRDVVTNLAGAHLYNLARDIGETTNLADNEPEKFKQLAAAWTEWNKGNIEPTWFPGAGGGAKKKAKAKQE